MLCPSPFPSWRRASVLCLPLALVLMALVLCAGCSSREAPYGDPGASGQPRLTAFPAHADEYVYVKVTGGEAAFNDDLSSLIVGYLQSDCSLIPADNRQSADIVIDVAVRDLALVAVGDREIDATRGLANTAMATTLGIAIGSLAGYREGALIGAGVGAAVGLGVTVAGADTRNTWALTADVTIARQGEDADPQAYSGTAQGMGMKREEAEAALKNTLGQDIATSLSGRR